MNSTFKLKKPKSDKSTLIYFRAYFKKEGKSLIYSTGESINPKEWDFENNQPINLSGRKKDAAELLGWGRNTLTRKLKEFGDDDNEKA